MGSHTFKVRGRMQGLNDYIKDNRGNKGKFLGNQMKKFQTEEVMREVTAMGDTMPRFTKPVFITFHWIEINNKRDPDNFIFAKKFVLDGMVKIGMLPNDGMKNIVGFKDTWEVRPETNGGVYVTVTEVDDV